ncbi:MAG: IS256 family transposase [Verrucomicrobiota bacterium]
MQELGRGLKSPADLAQLSREILRITVQASLNAEMDEHLGYAKHSPDGYNSGNSRNGYNRKTLKGDHGEIEIDTPRDRNGSFEPVFVAKNQTRLTKFDDQILLLYAKGMTTRDIVETFAELYGADISPALVSQVTDAVLDKVTEWQTRPLDAVYPILYLDCIVVKIRHDKRVTNKAVYVALGVNVHGHKELLGLWMSENEGAKFWLSVLTELKNRGVKDVFVACVDGLTGFPEAIATVFPKTQVQLCIVHMMRNALAFVSWKDRKAVAAGLKRVYQSITVDEAAQELEAFALEWDRQYPSISASWRRHWVNLIAFFEYPDEIRKVIYTTNAIESLNSVIRKATERRKLFPSDHSAMKVVYLAIEQAAKRWSMPIHNWKPALNQFMMLYEDRLPDII